MSDMRVITSSNKLLLLLLAPKCGPKRQFVTVVPHLASTTGPNHAKLLRRMCMR